jgi:hypothetical protein
MGMRGRRRRMGGVDVRALRAEHDSVGTRVPLARLARVAGAEALRLHRDLSVTLGRSGEALDAVTRCACAVGRIMREIAEAMAVGIRVLVRLFGRSRVASGCRTLEQQVAVLRAAIVAQARIPDRYVLTTSYGLWQTMSARDAASLAHQKAQFRQAMAIIRAKKAWGRSCHPPGGIPDGVWGGYR